MQQDGRSRSKTCLEPSIWSRLFVRWIVDVEFAVKVGRVRLGGESLRRFFDFCCAVGLRSSRACRKVNYSIEEKSFWGAAVINGIRQTEGMLRLLNEITCADAELSQSSRCCSRWISESQDGGFASRKKCAAGPSRGACRVRRFPSGVRLDGCEAKFARPGCAHCGAGVDREDDRGTACRGGLGCEGRRGFAA